MKSIRSLVLVSSDPASLAKGSQDVYRKLQEEIKAFDLSEEVELGTLHDIGSDDAKPMVVVYPEAVMYGPVKPDDIRLMVREHLQYGRVSKTLLRLARRPGEDMAWLSERIGALPVQKRVVLERAGLIDPESFDDYLVHDGFQALAKALAMTPADVIAEIEKSGLRGRGGAGFPSGRKMSFVAGAAGQPKYVICNADESEPGTFKDRLVLEGDPYSLVEAMTIAGYAVGAHEGYIYVRGEYPLAYQRLEKAIAQTEAHGLLGEHILGEKFHFHIHLHAGAGAYICGEETALIESIEGKRGMPRSRPPYPPTSGLWGKPTLVNNVETMANMRAIIQHGAAWYRKIGTPTSAGTKVYTILGNVNQTGAIEVPLGITLREVIHIYAQGMKNGGKLKMAQTGGSSGSIIPARLQDVPMDYDSFRQSGVALGSGALLICDEGTCIVDLAKVLLEFFQFESCGKCTLCRNGTHRSYGILDRISQGNGQQQDLDELHEIVDNLEALSNCGLGQSACIPLRDVLRHFEDELKAHIFDHVCPAGVCPLTVETPDWSAGRQPVFARN